MDIPIWKKWASHVMPLVLEESASEQNPELTVMLYRGRVQLLSGNAIYSWDDLYHNFTIAFERLKIEQRPISDVLLLGTGLGSVAYILEKRHQTRYHYTAVEWDEEVAELAGRYTLPRLKSPVEIVTADAEIFVEVCEEQFDLLVVDIFEDHIVPPQFETIEFLEACKALMRPGALLLYNRLYNSEAQRDATELFFETRFKTAFPEATFIATGGNWVLQGEVEK